MPSTMVEQNADEWVNERLLGQGGFGSVSLYRNVTTNERIAVKICRLKDRHDKVFERWQAEVFIMGKLNHDSVIRAVAVPDQLLPKSGELPVLAMEFCEGGDLRRVLNLPENVHGLKETEIRQLASGVGSAIEYLHSNKIVHRDLKPENIVLMKGEETKITYKIIDLGYAKELNPTSMCDSFVGTVQYLAPELYIAKPYTKTVDYWSFGCMLFECICGFRPFLPSAPPVQWHSEVQKKSPEDICAQYDTNKKVIFTKNLPTPNHLCKPLQSYFEQWLRLMLRFDPKARGGGVVAIQKQEERPRCFFVLEQMMNLHILNILYVGENRVLSYPVNETHTIETVQQAILQHTNIPSHEQRIILANGVKLSPTDLAEQGCCESNSEELIVFLFNKGCINSKQRPKKGFPAAVQTIVKEPNIVLPYKEHKKAWSEAVYWFIDQHQDYRRLVQSHRAALLNLLRSNGEISKTSTHMVNEMGKIMACKEQFQKSLDFDILQYEQHLQGRSFDINITSWMRMSANVEYLDTMYKKVLEIETKASALNTEILELQRSPYSKTERKDELEQYVKRAQALYNDLTKQKGDKPEYLDHNVMVELIGKYYVDRDKITDTIYKNLEKVLDCAFRLDPILPEVQKMCKEIDEARTNLEAMQQQRQAHIWSILTRAVSLMTDNTPESQPQPINGLSSFAFKEMLPSWSDFTSNLESLQLMDDGKLTSHRLQEIMSDMVQQQEESIQFLSSLESKQS